MLKIKASNIKNLTDARYFAAREVEWLMFNFVESDFDFISPPVAAAIFEWVAGAKIMAAVDFPTDAVQIRTAAAHWGWHAVQVGTLTDASVCAALKAENLACIKEFAIEPFTNVVALERMMQPFAPSVEAFQLNFSKNGITWQSLHAPDAMLTAKELRQLTKRYNIILEIDFLPAELPELLKKLPNLYGISLKGGEEESVGVKSFDEIEEIFDALEIINS